MIDSLGRRLRVAFGVAASAEDAGAGPNASGHLQPIVEFVAYGEDCLLSGRIRLAAERLTDMLNSHDEYELLDVMVERLDGSEAAEASHVLVARDDILLVQATGPRGSQARRQRTRPHPIVLRAGPYVVRGYFHALPGGDPITAIRRRKAMVPLTEASIELTVGGVPQRRSVGTLVVNREQIDWLTAATDEDLATVQPPELPVAVDQGPLVKDFTGQILIVDGGGPAGG